MGNPIQDRDACETSAFIVGQLLDKIDEAEAKVSALLPRIDELNIRMRAMECDFKEMAEIAGEWDEMPRHLREQFSKIVERWQW